MLLCDSRTYHSALSKKAKSTGQAAKRSGKQLSKGSEGRNSRAENDGNDILSGMNPPEGLLQFIQQSLEDSPSRSNASRKQSQSGQSTEGRRTLQGANDLPSPSLQSQHGASVMLPVKHDGHSAKQESSPGQNKAGKQGMGTGDPGKLGAGNRAKKSKRNKRHGMQVKKTPLETVDEASQEGSRPGTSTTASNDGFKLPNIGGVIPENQQGVSVEASQAYEMKIARLEEENAILVQRLQGMQSTLGETERKSREGVRRLRSETEDLRLLLMQSEEERVGLLSELERLRGGIDEMQQLHATVASLRGDCDRLQALARNERQRAEASTVEISALQQEKRAVEQQLEAKSSELLAIENTKLDMAMVVKRVVLDVARAHPRSTALSHPDILLFVPRDELAEAVDDGVEAERAQELAAIQQRTIAANHHHMKSNSANGNHNESSLDSASPLQEEVQKQETTSNAEQSASSADDGSAGNYSPLSTTKSSDGRKIHALLLGKTVDGSPLPPTEADAGGIMEVATPADRSHAMYQGSEDTAQ